MLLLASPVSSYVNYMCQSFAQFCLFVLANDKVPGAGRGKEGEGGGEGTGKHAPERESTCPIFPLGCLLCILS